MLADEVTHVKMGSDWLRRLTAKDPERQKAALDFQRTVDKLFSFGGFRGEEDENPIHLARKFRSLAGFSDEEITDLVDVAAEAYQEAQAARAALTDRGGLSRCSDSSCSTSTKVGPGSSSSGTAWPACGRSPRTGSRRSGSGRCGGSPRSSSWRSSSRWASASRLVSQEKIDAAAVPHVLRVRRAHRGRASSTPTGPR